MPRLSKLYTNENNFFFESSMTESTLRRRRTFIGVSLKMYFSPSRTKAYVEEFAGLITRDYGAVAADIVVLPDFLTVAHAAHVVPSPGAVGAQDCFWQPSGAFTGEISPAHLAELGVRFVEVGHAERRDLLAESDEITAKKVASAVKAGLAPIICVGEPVRRDVDAAAEFVNAQVTAALAQIETVADSSAGQAQVVLAYEPVWAIGQPEPAPVSYINAVAAKIRHHVDANLSSVASIRIIYGGSAKPGLVSLLNPEVLDGLFIGRFGHQVSQFKIMLDEALG
ncbi:Triosephosphate isomerase [Lipomyces japonicus]|uniref:Triosephosphate isomerase n=1 Tax=Lipomyces japonicus TaxID=56871 RepID=UPI0034CFBF2C